MLKPPVYVYSPNLFQVFHKNEQMLWAVYLNATFQIVYYIVINAEAGSG